MSDIHEARFYELLAEDKVMCTLCPHDCHIADGAHGACGVRLNHHGKLYTLVYDRVIARNVDPIEKKPLFHFQPGSKSYSISTVGCNLRCSFCQNWDISQWPKEHLPKRFDWTQNHPPDEPVCTQLESIRRQIPGERVTPAEIVDAALRCGATSIAYTYTEPTIFYELAYDTAELAHQAGLKNVFVTSGFINEQPLREIAPLLDAANIDLKYFKDESYRKISRVRLEPILEAIRLYHELGVWIEVTTLVIPGLNDSEEELGQIAEFVRSVGEEVPWHISQFYPAYKMLDRPRTPLGTLHRAREIGLEAGLRYVYEGNVPGQGNENTYCWQCGEMLIGRHGFFIQSNRISNSRCPDCGATIDGVELCDAPLHSPAAPRDSHP